MDKIYIRAGNIKEMKDVPVLDYFENGGCEIAYAIDEEAIYVGTKNGNVKVGGKVEKRVELLEQNALKKENIENQAKLPSDAQTADIVQAYNALIDALKK